jgi:hypothetical protein
MEALAGWGETTFPPTSQPASPQRLGERPVCLQASESPSGPESSLIHRRRELGLGKEARAWKR